MIKKTRSNNQKYPKSSFIIIIPIAIVLFLLLFSDDIGFQLFLGLVLFILFASLLYLIIAKFQLEVSPEGIYYQIKPFGKRQFIPEKNILNKEIVSIDFIGIFGGWGIRKKKGKKAYIFNDGKFLLVKTDKTDYYFSINDEKGYMM